MAEISQNVNIEMLEKLPDGTYKRKYPKTRADDGTTFDEHLEEIASLTKLCHVKAETDEDGKLILDIPKSNYNADRVPNENDDETQGYSAGSKWFVNQGVIKMGYICIDATDSTAIWQLIGSESEITLYESGNEHINITGGWVEGYSDNTGSELTKEENYISLYKPSGGREISVVTNNLINLSGIDKIIIYWGSTNSQAYSAIAVSTNKDGNKDDVVGISTEQGNFSAKITELNVQGLSGEYYVKVIGYTTNTSTNVNLSMYSISCI